VTRFKRGYGLKVTASEAPSRGLGIGSAGNLRRFLGKVLLQLPVPTVILLCLLGIPSQVWGEDALRLPTYDAGAFDPDAGPLRIAYEIRKDADEVEVLVEDFRGQIIERHDFVDLRAGDQAFIWRGLDENGVKWPDGAYRLNLQARFTDGSIEKARVEVRVASLPEEILLQPPRPLSPREYRYSIGGALSTFYRRNTEDEEKKDVDGEQRVRTHVRFTGAGIQAEGLFSMRRPYSREADYDGSQALVEKRWTHGRLRGAFRQSLGNFDDPMKLFSDFRTARKKVGVRMDQRCGGLALSAVGYGAEGDVDAEEKGLAGRITCGWPQGWRMGLNYTESRAIPPGRTSHRTNTVVAGELRVPLRDHGSIKAEYAATRNVDSRRDHGFLAQAEYERRGFRLSGGYVHLGEQFYAAYADPLRGVRQDAHGGLVNIDYYRPVPLWKLKKLGGRFRAYVLQRPSNGDRIDEADGTVRFTVGERDDFLVHLYYRKEGHAHNDSYIWTGHHRWNAIWGSSLQVHYTGTQTSHTWRALLGVSARRKPYFCRLALERIRRVIEESSESPFEETGFRFDVYRGDWSGNIRAGRNRRHSDSATNLFCRAEYRPEFLHRYRLITYVALGNRSAFETEKQIEAGMEFRF
jgi:hypothetical protein